LGGDPGHRVTVTFANLLNRGNAVLGVVLLFVHYALRGTGRILGAAGHVAVGIVFVQAEGVVSRICDRGHRVGEGCSCGVGVFLLHPLRGWSCGGRGSRVCPIVIGVGGRGEGRRPAGNALAEAVILQSINLLNLSS